MGQPGEHSCAWTRIAQGKGARGCKDQTESESSIGQMKSYADKHRVNKEFSVGDHVYLRVRARKSSLKLGSCAKLSPRYCGPFEVLERIGPVACRLALPASTRAHNVFHVSFIKRYVHKL